MTQTVGQMTEPVSHREISTQTALPRTNLSFSLLKNGKTFKDKITDSRSKNAIMSHFGSFDEQLKQNEIILRSQMLALHKIDEKLSNSYDEPPKLEWESHTSTPASDSNSKNSSDSMVQNGIDLDLDAMQDEENFNKNLASPSYSNSLEWERTVEANDEAIKLVILFFLSS